MYFFTYLLTTYILGVIVSVAFHVLNDGIDSFDKWNYQEDIRGHFGERDKTISPGSRILWASIFWFIYVPVMLSYSIILIPIYIVKKLSVKFLVLLFNTNVKIKTKLSVKTKAKQFIQKESKDYRTPSELCEVCTECHRELNKE
jgi:hypothetical protein